MSLTAAGKAIMGNRPVLSKLLCRLFNGTAGMNSMRMHGKRNTVDGLNRAILRRTRIRIRGNCNTVVLCDSAYLNRCSLTIYGDENKIVIGRFVRAANGDFYIEGDCNEISLGERATIHGYTHIAATEGKKVAVGSDCMFSANVTIRTGDSHTISDLSGRRVNSAKDVTIGDHVWFCQQTIVLKGAHIESHSVVGAGAVVTGRFDRGNVVIAGNPAKIVREGIDWSRERNPE